MSPVSSKGISPSPSSTPMPIDSPNTPYSSSQNTENPQDASSLDEDQVAENNLKSNATGGTTGKQFSKVWIHYHRVQVDGKWKAK
ncbi:hypothetical protein ACS0TY_018460 [Phlomoides rotata]